jgi:peptide/nickel transport system substrate-binding protein
MSLVCNGKEIRREGEVRKESLLLLIIVFVLLIAAFEPLASTTGPTQPPVDTTTLYVGRDGWGPKYADPVQAHDEYSQELIFNTYDRLIMFGTPVTNQYKTWDVQEQYWEFSPSLATNVPTRQETVADLLTATMPNFQIVVVNEEPIDQPFPIPLPVGTVWEDHFVTGQPIYAYKIMNWVDNGDGVLSPSDLVEVNVYLWAPTLPEKIHLVQEYWFHVEQVDQLVPAPPPLPPLSVRLHLALVSRPGVVAPVGTWATNAQFPTKAYEIAGWIDNNPDGSVGTCDVLYIKEYDIVNVLWDKIGQGILLEPVTVRTWHVLTVDGGAYHLHHYYYDFVMKTQPVINFVDETGQIVDNFDVYDAEYSFKRGLVQDPFGGPMYKFYKPLFDQMNSGYWNASNTENAIELAYLIKDAIEAMANNVLRINVGIPFSDMSFKQILCGTWASIVSKEYSISMGCWNGELFIDANQDCIPDWFQLVTGTELSPYDTPAKRYVGTGPYFVVLFEPALQLVVMQRNTLYWRGWPAPDRVGYLEYIDLEYIARFTTRASAFIACQLDICDIPRSNISYLLDPFGEPRYPEVKTIKNIAPVYDLFSALFTFQVDPTSPFIGTGSYPNGVPPDFFNDIHVRKAFAYSFNHTEYLAGAWKNEAICRETPDVQCLTPDYYTYGPDPPWTFDYNLGAAQAELMATGVWNAGFTLTMTYPEGDDDALYACTMIQAFFIALSTYGGRVGPPFTVNIAALSRPTFENLFEERMLPICVMKWHANYADADDFKRAYMHSQGCLAYFQGYTAANGWDTTRGTNYPTLNKDQLIDLAVKTPDGPVRFKMYADLDYIYVTDCPSFPIAQPLERKWMKYWVKGWYYNALYPSDYYYYKLYKADACWADVTSITIGVPDGICSFRDIGYIALHLGVHAPDRHYSVPYDPRWAPGTYGYGGCDVYGDRRVDMRDIGFAAIHFGHRSVP